MWRDACLPGSASVSDRDCPMRTKDKVTPIYGNPCEAPFTSANLLMARRWQPRDKQASECVHKGVGVVNVYW